MQQKTLKLTGSKHRLGELIVELGLIKTSDLDYVLAIASETSMPVGRVLVMSNFVSEQDLKNVLRCQTLLKEGLIGIDLARRAIEHAGKNETDIDEALYRNGWNPTVHDEITQIGDLLLQAHFITEEQLEQALGQQAKTRLPLGRILVLSGVISESLLTTAVNAQILVRDKKLDREQAIEALKHAKNRQMPLETSLKEKGFYELPNRACPRLGELLKTSGIITDTQLINCLEISLTDRKPLGQAFVEAKVITRDMLDGALQLQRLIAESRIGLGEARSVLMAVRDGMNFDDALENSGKPRAEAHRSALPLATLLKLFGCIDDASILQAFTVAQNNTQVISQVLLIGGILDETTLEKAEQCRQLIEGRRLTVERAGIAFDYSQRRGIDISAALQELQWQHGDQLVEGEQLPKPRALEYTRSEWLDLRDSANKEIGRGDFRSARGILKKLLTAAETFEDERYGDCLDTIAETYLLEQDWGGAQEYFKTSLGHKLKRYGTKNLIVAFAINNLGKVAYFQKRYDEAETYAREFIKICAALLGSQHPHVACGWQNVATICHVQNKYQSAEHAYRLAIAICAKSLGDSHPTTVRVNRNYANLLHTMNKLADAQGIDKFSQVSISGNWRAIDVPAGQALYAPELDDTITF